MGRLIVFCGSVAIALVAGRLRDEKFFDDPKLAEIKPVSKYKAISGTLRPGQLMWHRL